MDIKNKKIYISTLGCRVNLFETNQIQQLITANKGINCSDETKADIAIINTCCVTTKAMAKSRYFINKLSKCKKIKLIIVCGCYSQYKANEITNNKVGIIIGTKYKTEVIDLINNYDGTRIIKIDNILKEKKFEISNNTCEQDKTRGIIKIQDGCNFNCTYCIIPLVRGRQRSLSNKIIIADIKNLVTNGIKEIVLTGINTSGYNYGGISFFDLLIQINKIKGNFRVRISSLEPFQINHEIVNLITSNKIR
jgi:threonylcarbamoyladenosine tRNA methylthiotransferase MtaB